MTTSEEILKALDTINKYKKEVSDKMCPREYICICCRKNVMKLFHTSNIIHPLKQDKEIWDNGVVVNISCGYGSDYDLESFYIGICDKCLANAIKDKIIVSLREIRKELESISNREIF